MGLMANIFVAAFYGVMLLSLVYFIHKVMWFMRFRQLQAQLASNALATARSTGDWRQDAITTVLYLEVVRLPKNTAPAAAHLMEILP